MKHKMYLIAVLFLISTYSLFGQKPMEEDPYLLWQTEGTKGYSGFIIHPNGNIIANRGAEIFELDGNTGQVLKTFPVFVGTDINTMDVTKDGKILGAGFGNIILYDLVNDTVIGGISETNGLFAFFPDNKRFIARSTKLPPNNLLIYNIKTKERTEIGVNYVPWALATSPDGKYFATGGTSKEKDAMGDDVYYTILNLWDAQTLKPIKELAKIGGNFEVRSIKFSPDGKYVGFSKYLNDCYVYNLEDMTLIKHYNYNNVEYGVIYFGFLGNDLIGLSSGESFSNQNFMIRELINDKEIFYRHGKSGLVELNKEFNTIMLSYQGLKAYDLNKILTSIHEPLNQVEISVQYRKGSLVLTG